MKKLSKYLTVIALPVIAAVLTGCIVSGTFVSDILIRDLTFVPTEILYYEQVDLAEDETWQDHADDIKSIDLVGFELWITNTSSSDQTFKGYVDDANNQLYTTKPPVEANTTIILDELTLPANATSDSTTYISYPESFKYIRNLETLKTLIESGQINAYGITTGGSFVLDSMRVIVTFTAGQ